MVRRFQRGVAAFGLALAVGAGLLVAGGQPSAASNEPVIWSASAGNPAGIQASVDAFRAALGGNNGAGAPTTEGRREINWDGVPDTVSAPNAFPADFFNVNSPRGLVYATPGSGFQVSADNDNPTNTAVRFGNLDPSYTNTFQTFSAQRLFTPIGSSVSDSIFFVPGTRTPATVSAFGAVFTDVDRLGSTVIQFLNPSGQVLHTAVVPPSANGGLSFVAVAFPGGSDSERIARVRIVSGDFSLRAGLVDGLAGKLDMVAMDDFIYAEPRAIQVPTK